MNKPIVVISGPTASGKSFLALEISKNYETIIINADSMQVYKDIPIITAQPSKNEQKLINHALYGVLDADIVCSVGHFVNLAKIEIDSAFKQNKLPIIVGGSGLYIKSLIYGIASVPAIEDLTRKKVRSLYDELGCERFFKLLVEKDKETASRLNIYDKQRVIRAFEVIAQTGKSILYWQKNKHPVIYNESSFLQLSLFPRRDILYQKCNLRFIEMIKNGAIDEVKKLNNITIDPSLPVRKAHGVPEITNYLNNKISLDEAISKAQQVTRNYAKRQFTWFNRQMPSIIKLTFNDIEDIISKVNNLIEKHLCK